MTHRVPPEELPVIEKLIAIKNRLTALKRDRSTYMKTQDVVPLRIEIEEQVKILKDLRGTMFQDEDRPSNRTDDVLDEVCQLLSLSFLNLGKTRESPAVYSQVVAIKQCFDRLEEFGIYAEEFLEPYEKKLKEIEQILAIDERNKVMSEGVLIVLKFKFRQCQRIYQKLLDTIHEISPELVGIRNKLLRIRRQLVTIACRSKFSEKDIIPLQEELREINDSQVDGKFLAPDGSIPAGQAVVIGLLEQVFAYAHDLTVAASCPFPPALQIIRDRLFDIKVQLERLELTHKWTLRQTDLYTYQHQLQDICSMRYTDRDESNPNLVGKFLDERGEAPEGQTVLLFLLQKCYRMILVLLNESAPVSEALAPTYNQLVTMRQCLLAVKNTGDKCSPEELYPYQMKLTSIDNLRKDGIFYDDEGNVPEGQAICVSLLEECYSLLDELRELESETESNAL